MRIVTWNCRAAFAKKSDALFGLDADIAIIQECSKKDADVLRAQGHLNRWFGDEGRKGVAVFYKPEWELACAADIDQKWIIPIEVRGPENFRLIAVWTTLEKGAIPAYVKMLRKSLEDHAEWYAGGNVVVAGDFNSNCGWDKAPHYNHRSLVASLDEHGMTSAYHRHHKQTQGDESKKTFRSNMKKDYHIDYIFVPHAWTAHLLHCEVGTFEDWSIHSDHCPLLIDVASPSSPRQGLGQNWRDIK